MTITCYIKFTNTDSCNISKFGKCYRKSIVADSCNILRIVALSDQKRFGNGYFMSSVNLLRIVVNKSHLARRASHYVLYPKFLVNYPFVPLTAILDLSESVVWNESGTNRETRTNQERIMNRERIRNTGTNREHPLQWKCGALKKLRVTPSSGNIGPTDGNAERI